MSAYTGYNHKAKAATTVQDWAESYLHRIMQDDEGVYFTPTEWEIGRNGRGVWFRMKRSRKYGMHKRYKPLPHRFLRSEI